VAAASQKCPETVELLALFKIPFGYVPFAVGKNVPSHFAFSESLKARQNNNVTDTVIL